MVERSVSGSHVLMLKTAREFTSEEEVSVGDCDWHAYPMWKGSLKNPNWMSNHAGATSYRVVCVASIGESRVRPEEIQFEWDVSTQGDGVTGFKWGWYNPPDLY